MERIARTERVSPARLQHHIRRVQEAAGSEPVTLPNRHDGAPGPIGLADGIAYRVAESASYAALERELGAIATSGGPDRAIGLPLPPILRAAVADAVRHRVSPHQLVAEITAQENRVASGAPSAGRLWEADAEADAALGIGSRVLATVDHFLERAEQTYLHRIADDAFEAGHPAGAEFRARRRNELDSFRQALQRIARRVAERTTAGVPANVESEVLDNEAKAVLALHFVRILPMNNPIALAHLRKAAQIAERPETLAGVALALRMRGDGDARAHTATALRNATHPQTLALAFRAAADEALADRNYPRAIAFLRSTVRSAPDPATRAQAHLQLGRLVSAEARSHFTEARRLARAPQLRAEASLGLGMLNEADSIEHLYDAIAEAEDTETAARAHLTIGGQMPLDYDPVARRHFEDALNVSDVPNTRAEALLGIAKRTENETEQLDRLQAALPLAADPQMQAEIHLMLGQLGNGADLAHYQQAIRLHPESDIAAAAQLGIAWGTSDNTDAVAALKAALQCARDEGTRATAHYELGLRGDAAEASAHFRRTLEIAISPDLRALAHLELAKSGDGDVLAHFRTALQLEAELDTEDEILDTLEALYNGRISTGKPLDNGEIALMLSTFGRSVGERQPALSDEAAAESLGRDSAAKRRRILD